MRVMVLLKATKQSEAGQLPGEELLAAMGRYNEELGRAGILAGGEGLHPSSRGKRIRFSGEKSEVTDGPFSGDLLAGFWIWKVRSMDEAIEWARRCPAPMPGEEAEMELRPIFEAEDFGEAFTPELREREEKLRAELERQRTA